MTASRHNLMVGAVAVRPRNTTLSLSQRSDEVSQKGYSVPEQLGLPRPRTP